MAITKNETNKVEFFKTWLKNKNQDEYWCGMTLDGQYGLNKLKEFRALWKSNHLKPNYITWFATNKCNLFCDHCGQRSSKALNNELTKEEFLSLVNDFKTLGITHISISGGEPFIRPDIFEIIKKLKENSFYVGIISNGLIINNDILKEILCSELDSINISIDGLQEVHDKIRRKKGSFNSAIDFLKSIVGHIEQRIVVTSVHPNNINNLEELQKIIFESGATSWVLRPVAPTGRATEHPELLLNNEQLKKLIDFSLDSIKQGIDLTLSHDVCYLGQYDSILRSSPYFPSTGWSTFHILSNGDIKGLSEEYLPVEGNIRERSLMDIWKNEFKTYRNFEPSAVCKKCKYFGNCAGEYVPNTVIGQSCLVASGVIDGT